jgi:hypothetical protein
VARHLDYRLAFTSIQGGHGSQRTDREFAARESALRAPTRKEEDEVFQPKLQKPRSLRPRRKPRKDHLEIGAVVALDQRRSTRLLTFPKPGRIRVIGDQALSAADDHQIRIIRALRSPAPLCRSDHGRMTLFYRTRRQSLCNACWAASVKRQRKPQHEQLQLKLA